MIYIVYITEFISYISYILYVVPFKITLDYASPNLNKF